MTDEHETPESYWTYTGPRKADAEVHRLVELANRMPLPPPQRGSGVRSAPLWSSSAEVDWLLAMYEKQARRLAGDRLGKKISRLAR